MLKKCFFSVLTLLVFIPVWGQTFTGNTDYMDFTDAGVPWRKSANHWARKNSLIMKSSLLGVSSYRAMGMFVSSAEYDRIVYRNLSVSAIGLYTNLGGSLASDTYILRENFFFAGAKINYTLPVSQKLRLYFRVGFGGGVGIHKVTDYDMGENATHPAPALNTSVKPHFLADAYWVFRATPRIDFLFSPYLFSPSQILFGSTFNAPYNDEIYSFWDQFGTLGMSVRF
ncbi:MAG: hypothetical protein LBM20_02100 [Rikenellaceae bacterium]|nr:hypothetical protein [Rikenellaceae bacterium]